MRRVLPAAAVLPALAMLLAISAGACGSPPEPGEDTRERAYRANNLGVAFLEQFKYPEAADAFRDALRIDPSVAIAHVNLSLALFYAQDLPGAAREAAEAARLLPTRPEPPYILGLIARAENRLPDARRQFQRVRQIDPADVGSRVNLGQLDLEEQQYAAAEEVLRPAAAAEPYNVTAAYNLGLALLRGGKAAEGQPFLERTQALRETGYAVTYGTGYLEQGRYAEAVASTGAEARLVDPALPAVTFRSSSIGGTTAPTHTVQSPFDRRFGAGDLSAAGMQAIASGLGGGLTLIDADNDGSLDLFVATPFGQRLLRGDGGGRWDDVTAASGLDKMPPGTTPIGCVAGDYDNDGIADLFVLRYGGNTLYRNDGHGRFTDVTVRAGISRYPFLPGAAALVDVDHDGDLDLVIAGLADLSATRAHAGDRMLAFPGDFAPAPLQLWRNNGNGTFDDVTSAALLTTAGHAIAIVPTDFDNRRDVDLLIVNRDTPPVLFQNLRNGTFRDVAAEAGLAAIAGDPAIAAVTVADVNKDEFPDFYFGRSRGGLLALSDGQRRFTLRPAPGATDAVRAAQFLDYDNDGLLDLLTWSDSGMHLSRNLGERWSDVSPTALPGSGTATAGAGAVSSRAVILGDANGDGSTDVITEGAGAITFWRAGHATGRSSLRIRLKGRIGNRHGVGSKIELRAGSLRSRLETSAATPAAAPVDLIFGLGRRQVADVVRVLWPSGILQAETSAPGAAVSQPLLMEELDRKPSSCPLLFTWNGERFEFVTDFMGAGEMGYWEGPGRRNRPDPLEYVRIRGDQLQAKDGVFPIRVTNELEEALFADRLQLLQIAHPADIEVYPNEGMAEPAKPFRLFAVSRLRTPQAFDDHGHEVTDRIARLDRRYLDDFALDSRRGYAAPHSLTLDLAPLGPAPVLLLTGWTDYAFSSDNVAAHQAGLMLMPPSLQVRDPAGRWRTASPTSAFLSAGRKRSRSTWPASFGQVSVRCGSSPTCASIGTDCQLASPVQPIGCTSFTSIRTVRHCENAVSRRK